MSKGELTRLLKQITEAKPGIKKENRRRGDGRKEDPGMGSEPRWECGSVSPFSLGPQLWLSGLLGARLSPSKPGTRLQHSYTPGLSPSVWLPQRSAFLKLKPESVSLLGPWACVAAPSFRGSLDRDPRRSPAACVPHPAPAFSGVGVAGVSVTVGLLLPLPRCVPYNFILRPVVMTWVLLH